MNDPKNINEELEEVLEEVEEIEAETEEEIEIVDSETVILQKKIENLEQELFKQKDDFLRKAADVDNYRKRMQKEMEEKQKYASQSIVADFLPVLDNIELTTGHTEEGSPLRQGLELTIKSFKDTLAKYGVEEIDSNVGSAFDPAVHDAMIMDNNPEFDDNIITMSLQKGYKLHERVIRHAKVKVNKNK